VRSRSWLVLTAAACGLTLAACGSVNDSPGGAYGGTAPVSPTPVASAAASGSSSSGRVDACVTSQLKVAITHTGALAGQAGGYLRFTNDGAAPCRIGGWPVVTGLTAAGQATILRHAQSTMFGAWHYAPPLPLMTLRPGDSAYAVVAADDQPAGAQAHCPAPYVRLRVTPPGNSHGALVSAWLPGAGSYLPACTSASGSPTTETSAITPLSNLAH
jgi:Protein of unknown function (DUF4232)